MCKLALGALYRRVQINRKYPLHVEILHLVRDNLSGRKGNMNQWVIWNDVLLGFSFFLRGWGELEEVRPKDVRLNSDSDGVYMALFVK